MLPLLIVKIIYGKFNFSILKLYFYLRLGQKLLFVFLFENVISRLENVLKLNPVPVNLKDGW